MTKLGDKKLHEAYASGLAYIDAALECYRDIAREI